MDIAMVFGIPMNVTTLTLAVLGVVFALLGMVLAWQSCYIVRQAEVIIIERLGRYDRTLTPGMHFLLPFLYAPRQVRWTFLIPLDHGSKYYRQIKNVSVVDLRESVYDFPKQNVITKDNVTIEINALLYYRIINPKAAIYEIEDLPEAIEKLTQIKLRDVIGALDFDETLVSRDKINDKLRITLDEATQKWGVTVNLVELQEINPPEDIRHAMEKQMRAERDRRASILIAEGKKTAAILEAEGQQESQIIVARGDADARIIRAEGDATARITMAKAEADTIKLIQEAVPNSDPLSYLIAMQYVKSLPEMAKDKQDKLIILPYESATVLGSLNVVKKMLNS